MKEKFALLRVVALGVLLVAGVNVETIASTADFNGDQVVNFKDFAVLGLAWLSATGDGHYNPFCNISEPADDVIDELDLAEFVRRWLWKWPCGITTRVSVSSAGGQANSYSEWPSISADGRYVAFMSYASNLVEGDTNGYPDVFVHDCQTGLTSRVSVSSAGEQGNYHSYRPSISADGRYVAFSSVAGNLVEGDTNMNYDVFVRDRQTGETRRVSVSSAGEQGIGGSYDPSISADGRYVAFESGASNLVEGDTGHSDIFVHDRQTGETTRVSVSSAGEQGNDGSGYYHYPPRISADGRYVAFFSWASNLVEGDTNGYPDIFVHDRQTGLTTRVSVSSAGEQGNGGSGSTTCQVCSISADGWYVAFFSEASNLVEGDTNGTYDIFVHDRQTGLTTRVSVSSAGEQGNGLSCGPSISADGRYVAFTSRASNLVAGDSAGPSVFVHDRQTGETRRMNVSLAGEQGGDSHSPSISADGRYVAFVSGASNLVEGDTNGYRDVFVHDCFGG